MIAILMFNGIWYVNELHFLNDFFFLDLGTCTACYYFLLIL